MFKEVAVEPKAIQTWQDFCLIVQDCGVHTGRLISDFPRGSWKACVYQSMQSSPARTELALKRAEESLKYLVLWDRRRATFGPKQDWLSLAEQEHQKKAFDAIIASRNPNDSDLVLVASELDKEASKPWIAPKSQAIPRTPQALAAISIPLFAISKRVSLVDPHFAPEAKRFRSVLEALISAASDANPYLNRIDYHLKSGANNGAAETFQRQCSSYLPRIIPKRMQLRLFVWQQRPGGEKLHRRYILTDKGGLGVDVGLDEGYPGETTDIEILSREVRDKRWGDFHGHETGVDSTFQLIHSFTIQGVKTTL